MSLIRCPGCKLDTSDSLENCPSCGFQLGRSAVGALFGESRPPVVDRPTAAGSFSFATTPSPAAARPSAESTAPSALNVPKMIGLVAVLVVLALVPHAFPLLVVGALFWQWAKRRSSGQQNRQIEVLKIVVDEVRKAKKSPSGRPLDMLRRIEQQLPKTPRA